ncbi:glycosyltransferase [Amycolatopsis sp. NPDC051758]|uniref:glycosyltransferase n=1 Tax=Amycolatopsis sp. NPDC051758 TaxID=3363935 RepID=UPI00379F2209
MKIAMVSGPADPLAEPGGAGADGRNVHVAELAAALTRAGHDVTVHTHHQAPGEPAELRAPQGYRVVRGPVHEDDLPGTGEFGGFLRDRWAADRPDVVHAHSWTSGLAAALAANTTGTPVAHTFHGLGVAEQRHLGARETGPADRVRMERLLARRAGLVLATGGDEVFTLAGFGVPRSRISIVPGGVDLERFTPDGPVARRRAAHRLVAVGPVVPRKGFDLVLAALARLPDTELVIAGHPEPAEAARLRALADRLTVGHRVSWPGRVSRADLPALLRSADVVVCAPRYEPFGLVPLEAMACGVPVVATAVGGLTDTVVDGVTGLLVRPNQPKELASRLRRLLEDPALCHAYGTAGHDRVVARYSWDRVAADTLRAYRQLVPETTFTAEAR